MYKKYIFLYFESYTFQLGPKSKTCQIYLFEVQFDDAQRTQAFFSGVKGDFSLQLQANRDCIRVGFILTTRKSPLGSTSQLTFIYSTQILFLPRTTPHLQEIEMLMICVAFSKKSISRPTDLWGFN